MKVLFLTNVPAPYRVDFFSELGKYCDLTVLYDIDDEEIKDRNSNWFSTSTLNHSAIFLKQTKLFNKKISFEIIKYINDKSYDCIVIGIYSSLTAILAIEFMKFKHIPFILNSDGGFIKEDRKLNYHIKRHLISAAKIYASSGGETDEYLIYYGACRENILHYPMTSIKREDLREIESVIDEDKKRKIKEKLGIKEKFVILSVGQFIHRKGNDNLIKSFANIENEEMGLYIIGDKPTSEYINLVNDLGITNIKFIDFMIKEQLKEYYMVADLFVLPTREDIWGLVVNEALANGLPVITTNRCNAGLQLIKDAENGYVVSVDDIDQLSRKINLILTDKNKLYKMRLNALNSVKDYTIEEFSLKYFKIFQVFERSTKGEIK